MLGGRSIQLARVFGIRIGVNPSWFIVLFLIIWSLSDQYKGAFPGHDSKSFALATASALLLFFCVILHEFGHALVAMRNRIRIIGIDLWLFGGIATMADEPQTPGAAFRITVAGPIVTALIAGGCWLLGIAGWGLHPFWHSVVLDERFGYSSVEVLLGYLAFINTLLLVFNLLPAFPLDGGNIVRAVAWWRTGDRLRGTRLRRPARARLRLSDRGGRRVRDHPLAVDHRRHLVHHHRQLPGPGRPQHRDADAHHLASRRSERGGRDGP